MGADLEARSRLIEPRATELLVSSNVVNLICFCRESGRHLERIADLATNIAEDVIYLVDAEIVRHTPEVYED